jgi:DNA-binding CsgD family transcriptional regulator/tetratricopeptide (TPR) repeat protein
VSHTLPTSHRSAGLDLFAARSWRRAYAELSAADRAGELDASDLEQFATAAFLIGLDDEGMGALGRAHKAHAGVADFEGSARVACRLGLRLMRREPAQANGWLGRAARILEEAGCDDCVVHGLLSLSAGIRHAGEGQVDQAKVDFADAVAIGQRFGSVELVVMARLGEGRALIQGGEISRGNELLDEVMVAVSGGDVSPESVGIIYCAALEACDETFDVGRAREWTDAFGRWCDGEPEIAPNRGECLVRHAELMQLQGEWAGAITEVSRACETARDRRHASAAGAAFYRLAELHRLRGDLDDAEAAYASASGHGRQAQPGLALLRLSQGNSAAALGAIRGALDDSRRPGERAHMLRACVDVSLAVGDVARARDAAEELSRVASMIGAPLLRAAAAYATGVVELADGQARGALANLRDAAEIWRQIAAPYEVARCRMMAARAHDAVGDRDTARLELDAARRTFETLGAGPDVAHADALLADLTAGDSPAHDATLTDREIEVLGLVATGRTNRAVADALGISEKTVARHVSNIFGKLGVSTRSAATAYAHRSGLL